MRAYKQKGSFTIEATVIIPMVLFLMVSVMKCGLDFYQESKDRKRLEVFQSWDAVSTFYQFQRMNELGEEIYSD